MALPAESHDTNPQRDDVPKMAVRHADERWPDTDGEAIPMTDSRANRTVSAAR